jgi:hypothetical protein
VNWQASTRESGDLDEHAAARVEAAAPDRRAGADPGERGDAVSGLQRQVVLQHDVVDEVRLGSRALVLPQQGDFALQFGRLSLRQVHDPGPAQRPERSVLAGFDVIAGHQALVPFGAEEVASRPGLLDHVAVEAVHVDCVIGRVRKRAVLDRRAVLDGGKVRAVGIGGHQPVGGGALRPLWTNQAVARDPPPSRQLGSFLAAAIRCQDRRQALGLEANRPAGGRVGQLLGCSGYWLSVFGNARL